MEIGEFGVGRPDIGGRKPRGEALGKKRVTGLGDAPCREKRAAQSYGEAFVLDPTNALLCARVVKIQC